MADPERGVSRVEGADSSRRLTLPRTDSPRTIAGQMITYRTPCNVFGEIAQERLLRDAVSPEQLRNWYWNEQRSVPEISKSSGVNQHVLYELMRKHQISHRSWSETSYLFSKTTRPQFCAKTVLDSEEEKLKVAGIMLYWAEGTKGRHAVDFANSDPEMIRLFLKFLREICGVAEGRLRVYMYCHGNPDEVDTLKQYWRQLTDIPLEQFSRPYVRKGNPHRSGRIMLHGLVHIRYSDKKLIDLINRWIIEYVEEVKRAGTKVAKRGGL